MMNKEQMEEAWIQFDELKKPWDRWFYVGILMLICHITAYVYGLTMVGSNWLWLPFFICSMLILIPLRLISKKREVHLDAIIAYYEAKQDEHYRLMTGEDKR